jgi:hypothetical protein
MKYVSIQPGLEKAHEQGSRAVGAVMGAATGEMCSSCVGVIYPIVLLIFMLRPNVAAAFHQPAPGSQL